MGGTVGPGGAVHCGMASVGADGHMSPREASVGAAWLWAVLAVLDLLVGVPIAHVVVVALSGGVIRTALARSVFSFVEAAALGVGMGSAFVVAVLCSPGMTTFVADTVLFGHVAFQLSSTPVPGHHDRVPILLAIMVLCADYIATSTIRCFSTLVCRIILAASAATGGVFLACLILGEILRLPPSTQQQEAVASETDVRHDASASQSHCGASGALETVSQRPRSVASRTMPARKDPVATPASEDDELDIAIPQRSLSIGSKTMPTPKESAAASTTTTTPASSATLTSGFLDVFAAHKAEMAWLEAKGRLIKGDVLMKHGKAAATPRHRFVRLNPSSGCLEWWQPDASALVGQSPVSTLLSAGLCPGSNRALFRVDFVSRTLTLEAPTPDVAAQWLLDLSQLLQHKSLF
ncbi:PH domain-containing protein [Plasmodiophora brassicae]